MLVFQIAVEHVKDLVQGVQTVVDGVYPALDVQITFQHDEILFQGGVLPEIFGMIQKVTDQIHFAFGTQNLADDLPYPIAGDLHLSLVRQALNQGGILFNQGFDDGFKVLQFDRLRKPVGKPEFELVAVVFESHAIDVKKIMRLYGRPLADLVAEFIVHQKGNQAISATLDGIKVGRYLVAFYPPGHHGAVSENKQQTTGVVDRRQFQDIPRFVGRKNIRAGFEDAIQTRQIDAVCDAETQAFHD